jgi:hypothetical protein
MDERIFVLKLWYDAQNATNISVSGTQTHSSLWALRQVGVHRISDGCMQDQKVC